ncbi:MAG TPA: hypothetical protein VHE61_24025 [Opitutaceae bacterium]|nr:hypothetical protein [Opitutaceae bacterium]
MNSRVTVPGLGFVRGLAVALVLTLTATLAAAADQPAGSKAGNASVAPRQTTWAWRALIHETMKTPTLKPPPVTSRPADLSPLLLREEPDADVVSLPAFHVTEDRIYAGLHAEFVKEERRAHDAFIARRLGIGTHAVRYKNFAAGVVTVFYIPVFAGFGFSW